MTATLNIDPRPVPLYLDPDGVWRVTGTTLPLERVIECYKQGATPEMIVEAFDSFRLADVYSVIGYYLDHQAEVDAYLLEEENRAEELRREIEARQPPRAEVRARLLARKALLETQRHVPAGD
jgi:uncharacterized protein (DUF433 family)